MLLIIAIAIIIYLLVKNQGSGNASANKSKNKKNGDKLASSKIPKTPEIPNNRLVSGRSQQNIEDEYFYLSGVNIEREKKKWDERGKGYYGEFKVFEKLFFSVPGCSKFLMNLNVPTGTGKTTEIDLLMIHETGIYIFEVKHYKGTIYGKDDDQTWTQYFSTVPNHVFNNPIRQNDYHLAAVKNALSQIGLCRIQKNVFHSVVIFTNEEIDLRVDISRKDVIVKEFWKMMPSLNTLFSGERVWNIDEVDQVWRYLAQFAPIQYQSTVEDTGEPCSLSTYINALKLACEERSATLEQALGDWEEKINSATEQYRQDLIFAKKQREEEYCKQVAALKKRSKFLTGIAIIFCTVCLVISLIYCAVQKDKYQKEMMQGIKNAEAQVEVEIEREELLKISN